ncbi:MAG: reverse transcriptase domain-containing protein, partial [Xenococcus sp. (in: cyanobacteria)]
MRQKVHLEPFLYESCEVLAKKFQELESSNDVAELLRIPYRYLVYHIYRISADNKYKTFHIPKKSGGYRTIYSPNNSLRIVQRKLSQVLYAVYRSKPSVHGFAPSRSIITNAQAHVKKKFILNIDIKNFFDSINFGRVRGLFMRNPYKLNAVSY